MFELKLKGITLAFEHLFSEAGFGELHASWVWGCLFFHSRSLFLCPLHFGIASFFIGGLCFLANE
jgi:hypothetical protein